MTPAGKIRYPVATHVRLRQVTWDVIVKYADMHDVKPSDAHRMLLDIACAQYAGLLDVAFKAEEPVPPSLSTVRRRKAAGQKVPGAVVANARRAAKAQAINRRQSARGQGAA